jgi:hypothetical protein
MYYKGGQLLREGEGLSFFYFAPLSVIVTVPMASTDVPFVFNEVSADFQEVTIQGQLTYRVSDAKKLARLMDFSLDAHGRFRSEDPEKLSERLIHAAQILTRAFTQRHKLAELLISSEALVQEVLSGVKQSETVAMLGIEILGLSILSLKPTPEMAKALQANTREQLLKKADEAIFDRRKAAVELERQIKESELNTEIAVEQKRRQVRETQMQAEIAVEEQRSALVQSRVENERHEADARAYALKAVLDPMKDIDWRTLMAASSGTLDAGQLIAMAFRDLADNAQKIGNLDITSELVSALVDSAKKRS